MSQIVAIKPDAIQFDSEGSYSYDSARSYPISPTKCEITMKLNGAWSLTLEVPFDEKLNEYIVEEGIIGVTMRDALTTQVGIHAEQTFRIEKVVRTQYLITVDAYQTFLDAEQYMVADHIHIVDKPAHYAIDYLFNKLSMPFGIDVDESDEKTATAYWEWKNAMECLNDDEDNSFVNRWGGEFLLDNHRFYWRRKIDRFQDCDNDELIRISAGVNMTNVNYTIDTSSLVTEVWAQAYNGRHYGTVISQQVDAEDESKTDYVINYLPLRSTHFDNFTKCYPSNITYDKIKLKEDAGESETEDITVCDTYEQLNEELEKAVKNDFEENELDVPTITYDVDFTDLTALSKYAGYESLITLCLGDSCYVYNEDLKIETVARVQQITYDGINEVVTGIVLGDYAVNYFTTQADYGRTLEKVLDVDNGGVKAETVKGVIDGQKSQVVCSLNAENQNGTRIVKVENTQKTDKYGALALGSDGLQATIKRLEKTTDGWDWTDSVLVNSKGTWYGKVGNHDDSKYIQFKDDTGMYTYDGGVSGTGVTGVVTVDSFMSLNGVVVGEAEWDPVTYTLELKDRILALKDSNGHISSVKLPESTVEYIGSQTQSKANGISSVTMNSDYTLTLNFDNGTSYTTLPIRGEDGKQGPQGEQGIQGLKGDTGDACVIVSQDISYQESESATVVPIGEWQSEHIDCLQGNYLWCRVKQIFSDGTETIYFTVSRFGVDGAGGGKGETGVGVSEIKHYYLATGLDTGVTRDNNGWTELIQKVDETKKYLWRYDETIWTNDSKTYTEPYIYTFYNKGDKGDQGEKGDKGDQGVAGEPGADGKTSYTHFAYANSSDGQIGFSTSVSNGKSYIGIYVDSTENDSTDPAKYNWSQIKGDKGTGFDGDPIEHFAVNNDSTTAPTRWSNSRQQPDGENKYLWYYETIKFTDGTSWDSTPRIIATFADGFTDITAYYCLSTSGTEFTHVDGYDWTTTMPSIQNGMYLWQKYIILKNDNTTEETTPVVLNAFTDLGQSVNSAKQEIDDLNATVTTQANSITEINNNFSNYYTKTETNTQITQTANSINQTVSSVSQVANSANSKIDNLEIGGRNLLLNSSIEHTGNSSKNTNGVYYDFMWFCYDGNKTNGYGRNMSEPFSNGQYTLSFDAKSTVDGDKLTNYIYYPEKITKSESSQAEVTTSTDEYMNVTLTTEYKRYWITRTYESSDAQNSLLLFRVICDLSTGDVTVKNIKLEKGNKATDWTPAPEDTQSDIDDVTNALTNTRGDVSSLQSTTTQLSSQVETALSGISTNVTAISQVQTNLNDFKKTTQSDIKQSADSLKIELSNSIENTNKSLDNVNTTVSEMKSYMNFTTDSNSKPVLELGASGSNFKTRLSNSELAFMQGETKVAYISESKLNITEADINTSLKIGDFAFVPRSNGSLDFKKVGGS